MAQWCKPNRTQMWQLMCHCSSMQEATEYIRRGGIKDSQGNSLRFKTTALGSGGKTRKAFQCISHGNCPVVVRAVLKEGGFLVESKFGLEHSKEVATEKRAKNSTLTMAQEAALTKSVNEGSRPAAILSNWTSQLLDEDPNAQKRRKGGLAGKPSIIYTINIPLIYNI